MATALQPARVTFEITEDALMQDYDTGIIHIEQLREIGVAIALDDFGTGYSTLSYLTCLPIGKINGDRSFVSNLAKPAVRKITAAILGLCETMQGDCIAEGIKTSEDCQTLGDRGTARLAGCKQGLH